MSAGESIIRRLPPVWRTKLAPPPFIVTSIFPTTRPSSWITTMRSESTRHSGGDIMRIFVSGRMLTALLMGFSSGLPLLLASGSVLQAWLKEAGVDLGTIGLFALVGLPYTLKFLWAPLLDRFVPIAGMGRRRGWLLLIQLALMAAIAGLGFTDPTQSLPLVTLAAFLVAFFSASQDIVVDAYRRESLADDEQGLGASVFVLSLIHL